MKRYAIKIRGRVQGVFFRDSARQEAERLGLVGFARNEPDGTVYIEAGGNEAALDEFVAWCHEGSAHSKVEGVHISEISPVGDKDFNIR